MKEKDLERPDYHRHPNTDEFLAKLVRGCGNGPCKLEPIMRYDDQGVLEKIEWMVVDHFCVGYQPDKLMLNPGYKIRGKGDTPHDALVDAFCKKEEKS